MNELLAILRQSSADDFVVRETTTQSSEAFMVGHKLDMNRKKEVVHTVVDVFVDNHDHTQRGKASKEIHPAMDETEIQAEIAQAIYAAQFAMNPYYRLVSDKFDKGTEAAINLDEKMAEIIAAVQHVHEADGNRVNSYEVFVNHKTQRIVNSRNVDVTFSQVECVLEVIINSRQGDHEVELYNNFVFRNPSPEQIKQDIEAAFKMGQDRLAAVATPQFTAIDVAISGRSVADFFDYFLMRSNGANVYLQHSDLKLGQQLTGQGADGFTIENRVRLEHSSHDALFDQDGSLNENMVLFDQGECVAYWGSNQYAQYLQLQDCTGLNNVVVSGGSLEAARTYERPCLEIVDFSDFFADPLTGNFGGEIRLAYLHEAGKVTPVSGGSLSANMKQVCETLRFTKQTVQYNNRIVPQTIVIQNVAIAGN